MWNNFVNWITDTEAIDICQNMSGDPTEQQINAIAKNPAIQQYIKKEQRENRAGGLKQDAPKWKDAGFGGYKTDGKGTYRIGYDD